MATYYQSLSNQRDVLPSLYLQDQKLAAYHESLHLPGNKMDPHLASTAASHEMFSGNYLGIPSGGSRNEMVFSTQEGDPGSMQSIGGNTNITTGVSNDNCVSQGYQMVSRTLGMLDHEQNMHFQELSLTMGTQISSAGHVPSIQDQFTGPGLSSLLSSHVPDTGEDCLDFSGGMRCATKVGALNNPLSSVSTKDMCSDHLYERSSVPCAILNSEYLKAAQQLLDEVLNVQKALKQPESEKHHKFHKFGLDGSKETDDTSKSCSVLPLENAMTSNPQRSTTNSPHGHSPTEQQDLLSKMTKLLSMLDEVDRRYNQYYHQMQTVVSSFEMVAGFGAAKPYTALALQTISRQFRCVRDALSQQIRVTRQRLGEVDATSNSQGGGLSQLRYVDQQLRQRRALQQIGMMQHSWRPQRGLPDSSVSILRAWLFEHFLHPYPKDSEKIMLARQTGLNRNQVANWFINARVRLWKPMIEEMYKEEFGDSEADAKSSPEQAAKAKEESWATEHREEELQVRVTSSAADYKPDFILDVGIKECTTRDCGVMKLPGDKRPNKDDHSFCSDQTTPPDHCGDGSLMSGAATSDTFGFPFSNQESLALGLRHNKNDPLLTSGGMQLQGVDTAESEVGVDKAEFPFLDPVNQQHRFDNPHLVYDFVA
ncbi:unnamed protein product [Ilex paraguariensis]|uniref:Homeobox domain-containing protein n=1 Tax=Ilex paraguariensis TaxID=185542 RepID=A0ABC8UAD0_9AQUA